MPLTNIIIRLIDLLLSLSALVLLSIPMLIIAIAIYLEDKSPVLFRQPRVGKATKCFVVYKFRTMFIDKDRALGSVTDSGDLSAEREHFITTSANDPRITKMGRVLRPLHLDELPQLYNVLIGDMSIVGVRPDVPVQEADYSPEEWRQRHQFRPGITGVAQVDATITSMADRTNRDLYWCAERSIELYVKVLFLTVRKVAKRNSL